MLETFGALVITGGSSGIGKSFVEHVGTLHPGLVIFNLSRRFPEINVPRGVGEKPRGVLRHIPCDLSDPAQVAAACEAVESGLLREVPVGRILIVNNSGYGTYGPFCEPDLRRNLDMLNVNMRAPVEITGRLLPLLRSRGGAVVNVASTAAFQPLPGMATYAATKAFVLHWSLALAEELRPSGVQVLAVCPGPTRTRFFANAGLERANLAVSEDPADVVRTILRALARGRSLAVSGWFNRIGAFLASKAPKVLATKIGAGVVARFRPRNGGRGGSA